jgi:hypothetical protein
MATFILFIYLGMLATKSCKNVGIDFITCTCLSIPLLPYENLRTAKRIFMTFDVLTCYKNFINAFQFG